VKVVKAKSAKMLGARARARAREVEKTKTGSTKNAFFVKESFFSKHPIKTSDVFQKTLDFFQKTSEIFLKTWEIFLNISHVI
jgi:hypothetical protein